MEVKKSTLLHQNPKLAEEKAFFFRSSKDLKPREKSKVSKCYQQKVSPRNVEGRPLFLPKSSRCEHKLWPTKVSDLSAQGELVKHMSNVPDYLQRADKGGDVQEKALNFGVIDWQHLEKWNGDCTHINAVEKPSISPVSSNGSSSISMSECSSQSCGSSISNGVSANSKQSCTPATAYRRYPDRHRISYSGEKHPIVVNLAAKFEEVKQKVPELHSFPDDLRPSLTRSKDSLTTSSVDRQTKLFAVSDLREKRSRELRSGGLNDSANVGHHSGFSEVNDSKLGSFQKIVRNSGHFKFEYRETGRANLTESVLMSSSGAFPSDHSHLTSVSCNASGSPPRDGRRRHSYVNVQEGSEVLCDSIDSSPFLAAAGLVVSPGGFQEKQDKFAKRPPSNYASEKWDLNVLKPISLAGEPSPINHPSEGSGGTTRVSSLKEISAMRQPRLASFDKYNGDKVTDASRGRRSPLRRLLDPLLKAKPPSRACSPTPRLVAGSRNQPSSECKLPINEELVSVGGLHRFDSSCPRFSSDDDQNRGSNSASRLSPENHPSTNEGKRDTTAKQALLRLVWKNGSPLLTLSVNENDILAATRRKSTSTELDCDYTYAIHYVHEIKRKTGGWISQGNKGNRKELISRMVGQMNVSRLRSPTGHAREFNLFGPELRPTASAALEPALCSELAAIVIRIPEESVEHSTSESSCLSSSKARLSQNRLKVDPPIVAILPGQVHGLSERGNPSPLVERWKSGGSCDCGGWDVGCSLSILTSNPEHRGQGAAQPSETTDGTHRVELFAQGGDHESRPVFNLVAFKEELYTVHFHSSITPLQAFAICIALVHTRKHTGLDESFVGPSSMSTPYHPPLSPVGRA